MKKNSGLTGIQILATILAFVVLFGLAIPRILMLFALPGEQKKANEGINVMEVKEQIKEQREEAENQRSCFNTSDFWYWSAGDKRGRAQISFSPNNKGALGNLLANDKNTTIYSFQISSTDSKFSLAISGQEPKAYGTGSITCKTITLNIEKACSRACTPDEPNDYENKKIDPSSIGLPKEISIVQ